MSRATSLLLGVPLGGAAYALALWWFVIALGIPEFPTLLSMILAVPPIVAGWIAFRRNPSGWWWTVPTIAVVVTSAAVMTVIYILLSSSSDL